MARVPSLLLNAPFVVRACVPISRVLPELMVRAFADKAVLEVTVLLVPPIVIVPLDIVAPPVWLRLALLPVTLRFEAKVPADRLNAAEVPLIAMVKFVPPTVDVSVIVTLPCAEIVLADTGLSRAPVPPIVSVPDTVKLSAKEISLAAQQPLPGFRLILAKVAPPVVTAKVLLVPVRETVPPLALKVAELVKAEPVTESVPDVEVKVPPLSVKEPLSVIEESPPAKVPPA